METCGDRIQHLCDIAGVSFDQMMNGAVIVACRESIRKGLVNPTVDDVMCIIHNLTNKLSDRLLDPISPDWLLGRTGAVPPRICYGKSPLPAAVDQKLAAVAGSLLSHAQALDDHNRRLDHQKVVGEVCVKRIDANCERLDAMDDRVDAVNKVTSALDGRIQKVGHGVGRAEAVALGVSARLEYQDRRQNELETRIMALEEKMKRPLLI